MGEKKIQRGNHNAQKEQTQLETKEAMDQMKASAEGISCRCVSPSVGTTMQKGKFQGQTTELSHVALRHLERKMLKVLTNI